MTREITFQELIDKVKGDLFSPYKKTEKESKISYPIFFVEQVELEIAMDLSYDAETGLKISIPQVFEASGTGGQGKVSGHRMKVILTPILSREQLRAVLSKDKRLMKGDEEANLMAFRKGIKLAGEED